MSSPEKQTLDGSDDRKNLTKKGIELAYVPGSYRGTAHLKRSRMKLTHRYGPDVGRLKRHMANRAPPMNKPVFKTYGRVPDEDVEVNRASPPMEKSDEGVGNSANFKPEANRASPPIEKPVFKAYGPAYPISRESYPLPPNHCSHPQNWSTVMTHTPTIPTQRNAPYAALTSHSPCSSTSPPYYPPLILL
ncbi:hypothetical protein V500_05839 [Pseudogymnoascus sp. VKM F-4518 (FW-2643)]|nr:hypothetical protein V500_05839 [Pseudogymnoascus sp. VKM F-4518 (FW-2643)]